jgi:protocatechuate 3,4-dioxygenase beta subunit
MMMGLKKTLILFFVSIVCFVHHSVAREVTCTGIVIDAQDEPIAGVKVTLYEIENNRATYSDNLKVTGETVTDTDGKFSLSCSVENQKHRYGYIVAQKEGLALGFDNWRIRDGNKKLEIRLGEGEEVTGIVVDEDGNPIPDAKVSIALMTVGGGKERRVLNGVVTKEFFAAQTDKDGKFIFNDIPTEAKVGFTVKKTGRAAISTYQRTKIPPFRTLKCYSSRDDIKLVMSVEARLEGIVVEKNTGRPIAGVRMLVGDDPRYIFLRHKLLVSGEDGTFSIGALTPERYVVQLDEFFGGTQDWVAEPVEVIAEAGEIKSGLKLELCKGGILEIVATDASYKKPVENANVDVMRQNENPVLVDTHTNEEGIARVRLLPGEYRGIRIFKEGYSNYQQRESFTIEEGRTKRIELQLTRLPGITGTVKDENGKPVEGATLQVCPMGKDSTTSGAEGKFEVDWDLAGWNSSGCPLMYLVGRYDKDNLAAAVVIKEDTGAIDLQLEPGVTLTGKIVDPNGKGIADSQITVMFQTQDWMTAMGQDIAQIDAEGNVKVRAIPAGYKYGIYARANGYGEDFIEVDTEDAVDNRFDGIKLTLNVANLSVSGIVVDMDDKPVTGANVSCYRDNQFSLIHRRVKTDINGKLTIDKI